MHPIVDAPVLPIPRCIASRLTCPPVVCLYCCRVDGGERVPDVHQRHPDLRCVSFALFSESRHVCLRWLVFGLLPEACVLTFRVLPDVDACLVGCLLGRLALLTPLLNSDYCVLTEQSRAPCAGDSNFGLEFIAEHAKDVFESQGQRFFSSRVLLFSCIGGEWAWLLA